MISSETPYKLAEIIRDTWPQLYFNNKYNTKKITKELKNMEIKKNVFVVYSKDGCPWCVKIKQALELAEVTHVVYNLDEHFTREDFYKEFGEDSTFPQVMIDGTPIGGCSDTIKYMKEQKIVNF
jgi:glutaredoxin